MGLRVAAFAIDVGVILVLSLGIMLGAFFSMAERAPSSVVRCANTGFDLGAASDPATDSSGDALPQFCVQDGDDVLFVPVADENTFAATFYLAGFLLGVLDLVVLQGITSASLGKTLVGLRVVRPDGRPAGVGRALVRYVLLAIDAGCCFIIGVATSFTTPGHRRVGDMAADTLVVSKNAPAPAPAAGGWPRPQSDDPSAGGDGPFWDADRDTYIQYDRPSNRWLEWHEASGTWVPISR